MYKQAVITTTTITTSTIIRANGFPRQILPNSTAQFANFRKIPWHYYPQIPYILQPVGIVVLTDNTSKNKEFIVTCDTKTHYIRSLMVAFFFTDQIALIDLSKNLPFFFTAQTISQIYHIDLSIFVDQSERSQ